LYRRHLRLSAGTRPGGTAARPPREKRGQVRRIRGAGRFLHERMRRALALAALLACAALPAAAQVADLRSKTEFRVCADPAAVPMSSQDEQGFENRIARLFAEKLGLPVAYTWFPQGPGFIRKT